MWLEIAIFSLSTNSPIEWFTVRCKKHKTPNNDTPGQISVNENKFLMRVDIKRYN